MELMVVIAIIGILAAITTPNLISWRLDRHYNDSLQTTIAIINSTKARAIKENTSTVILFDAGAREIRAFEGDSDSVAWDDNNARIHRHTMGPGVSIVVPDDFPTASGRRSLEFNERGLPEGFDGGTITLQQTDRGLSNQININITGRIRTI